MDLPSPPPSSSSTFLKEPSPRPRTGIKFNCLPVAFGRVRNREEQLFRSLGLVPSTRVTSRRIASRFSSEKVEEEEEEEEERTRREMQIRGGGVSREGSVEKKRKGLEAFTTERNKSWPYISFFENHPLPSCETSFPRPPSETPLSLSLCPRAFFFFFF